MTIQANDDMTELYIYALLSQEAVADIKAREPQNADNRALPEELICVALDVMKEMSEELIPYEEAQVAFVLGVSALVSYRKQMDKLDDERL